MIFYRSDLIQALEQVKGAIAKKDFVPILQNVLIEGDTVLAFDSEIGIRTKLKTTLDGKCSIKLETFLNLLKGLEEDEVDLTVEPTKVRLKCGRHKSALAVSSEEFPKPNIKVGSGEWSAVPAGFKEALERAAVGCLEDENNRELSAIFVRGANVYGGCGNRMVRCTIPGMDVRPLLLPRKAVDEVCRLGNPKRMAVKDSVALFDFSELMLLARLRDPEKYPAERFDKLLASTTKGPELPAGIGQALLRLKVLANEKDAMVKCEVDALDGSLTLSTRSQSGEASEMLTSVGQFEAKGVSPNLLALFLPYAQTMAWGSGLAGNKGGAPFYLTGEVAGFEGVIAPMALVNF